MVVNKEFILAAYCDACQTQEHGDAVSQVAGMTGQAAETIERVVQEEEVGA